MRYFQIKNFRNYQHYKKRKPPWIKLYFSLLNNYKFNKLDDAGKFHYIALIMLASQYENRLEWDEEHLSKVLHTNAPLDLNTLQTLDLIEEIDADSNVLAKCYQNASKMLASRYQNATPETETEAETKTEHKGETLKKASYVVARKGGCGGELSDSDESASLKKETEDDATFDAEVKTLRSLQAFYDECLPIFKGKLCPSDFNGAWRFIGWARKNYPGKDENIKMALQFAAAVGKFNWKYAEDHYMKNPLDWEEAQKRMEEKRNAEFADDDDEEWNDESAVIEL